jgi:hypothetical protein
LSQDERWNILLLSKKSQIELVALASHEVMAHRLDIPLW